MSKSAKKDEKKEQKEPPVVGGPRRDHLRANEIKIQLLWEQERLYEANHDVWHH